jgi:hypothetical protein
MTLAKIAKIAKEDRTFNNSEGWNLLPLPLAVLAILARDFLDQVGM